MESSRIAISIGVTLDRFIRSNERQYPQSVGEFSQLLRDIALASKVVNREINKAGLIDIMGAAGNQNTAGDEQQKLDVLADIRFTRALSKGGAACAIISEEEEGIVQLNPDAKYIVAIDPLDGSSNIDVNVSIGTIFSVLKKPTNSPAVSEADFLQAGNQQVAAGYCVYGPQTTLVLTVGNGVAMFTLDREQGSFVLTHENVKVPEDTQEFAINMSNMRHWDTPVKRYVDECLAGTEGPREKNFNMRWIASMVADVHRILTRGGVFMYPWDKREPNKPGKLRLMYEANPMSWLIEQAGGAATNGKQRILDIKPDALHQRVSVILGSKNEVHRVTEYHA